MSVVTAVHISAVIPVYNGAGCLPELYRRLKASLESITERFEIILVEDCGPDDSWAVIEELAERDPRVRGALLSRNFGQHNAITAGLSLARGDWIVVLDCDLQDRPEEIPRLYAKAQEGFDCVLASRVQRRDRWQKRLTSALFYKVFNYLTDLNYDGSFATFSIVSRAVVEEMLKMKESVRFYGAFLTWMGFSRAMVEVEHSARYAGESSYTLTKLFRMAFPIILSYSNKPLRLCVSIGLTIAGLSMLAGVYQLVRSLFYGIPVEGWASLIISIYFSTGAIISTLGILGLYIDRIFIEVKGRPLFIIRKRTFD